VCAPAQRKPFELIVIKALTFRYLPLTNKAPEPILRHKRAIAKIIRKLCLRHGLKRARSSFMREVTVVQIRTALFVVFSPTL
jgi:2'-5' RNA ligase